MLGKKIYIAICISAIIHCALLAAATYLAYRESVDTLGGGDAGENIAITVLSEDIRSESPSGSMEIKSATKPEQTRMIAPSPSQSYTHDQVSSEAVAMHATETSQGGPSTGLGSGNRIGPGSEHGEKQLTRIWSKINRSKYYPLHARRNSWEGDPRVTFKIGNEGEIEYVRLAKSCGISELDDAAIETVKRAVPLPHYPKPITLTIRYSLRE